jgi:hypothetical protein
MPRRSKPRPVTTAGVLTGEEKLAQEAAVRKRLAKPLADWRKANPRTPPAAPPPAAPPTRAQTRRRQAAAQKRTDRELAKTPAGRAVLARVAKEKREERRKDAAAASAKTLGARRDALYASRSYSELLDAVRAEGGIRPDRDYKRGDFPAAARGGGHNAPDEILLRLERHGFHYGRADDLIEDLRKRSARRAELRARTHHVRRTASGELVVERIRRDPGGEYAGRGREPNDRHAFRDRFGRFRER